MLSFIFYKMNLLVNISHQKNENENLLFFFDRLQSINVYIIFLCDIQTFHHKYKILEEIWQPSTLDEFYLLQNSTEGHHAIRLTRIRIWSVLNRISRMGSRCPDFARVPFYQLGIEIAIVKEEKKIIKAFANILRGPMLHFVKVIFRSSQSS